MQVLLFYFTCFNKCQFICIAVIVLIYKGDKILLVHSKTLKKNVFGLVAGFVEIGENIEEAVMREVEEETGLKIKNLRYKKSQPWPYPSVLMLGFFAEYSSGDIKLQEEEIEAGNWFRYNELPTIPDKASIARQLIDEWMNLILQTK